MKNLEACSGPELPKYFILCSEVGLGPMVNGTPYGKMVPQNRILALDCWANKSVVRKPQTVLRPVLESPGREESDGIS